MDAVQQPGLGHLAQIAADGLHGDVETLRQIVHQNPAFGTGEIKDFVLANAQGQGLLLVE